MADPVGTTLGILGLVGSIVEVIHIGYAAKGMSASLRRTRLQLELEGSILQGWAENVLLVDEGLSGGTRAIPASTSTLVVDVLKELLGLFEESAGIVSKYRESTDEANLVPLSSTKTGGARRARALTGWLSAKKVPRPEAFKWAIRDAPELEELATRISGFRKGLEDLLPKNLELFRVQMLMDTVVESTGDQLRTLRAAAEQVIENNPTDAPAMHAICAAALIREQLPRWQLDAGNLQAYITALAKSMDDFTSPPPADMTLWSTNFQKTSRELLPVLVEWRKPEPGDSKESTALFERDIIQLSNLLSSLDQHPDAHLPRCLGYVKDQTRRGGDTHPRYGLIFSCPSAQTSTTLLKIIEDTAREPSKHPDVAARLRMALDLAISVFQLMAAGWLHKGVTSASIAVKALLPSPSPPLQIGHRVNHVQRPELNNFLLLGFQSARLSTSGQPSRNPARTRVFDTYRHPSAVSILWDTRQYRESGGYHAHFDVYALGAVLVELGLWRTLGNIRTSADAKMADCGRAPLDASTWSQYLKLKVEEEMPGRMGGKFAAVASWCLGIGEGMVGNELLAAMEEKVIRPLIACRL